MWQLDNHTPYAADNTWIRDADGAEIWIVAVKASYELLPGGHLRLAARQLPLHHGTVLHEDGVSPIFETDLGPPKPATDVWVHGHAWSQSGKPVTQLGVGFAVGPIQRALLVHGDRVAERGLLGERPGPAQPFTRMPLTWARAFGGDGPDCASGNPVGCGIHVDADGLRRLPNLEHPLRPHTEPRQRHPAMGVGPVPRHWPGRTRYAGSYDAAWQATRAPLLPADLDPRHWQVAPPEQQAAGHLKGGEHIALHKLTPPGFAPDGLYHGTLPRLTLGFRTRFYDGSLVSSHSTVHSVILQPDGVQGSGPLLSVVHHMALPCHAKVNLLHSTTITEKRRPLDRPDPQMPSPARRVPA